MKTLIRIMMSIFGIAAISFGECGNALPVKGVISVDICNPKKEDCIPSNQAVNEYLKAEDDSTTFSIGIHSSPWHIYDPEMRIIRIDKLAEMIRPGLKPIHRAVVLIASWTGVSPDSTKASLAKQLSDKLDGFPVQGQDGFVWLSKDGNVRTTKQGFTMYQGVYTHIHKGEDVFVSMTKSWFLRLEEQFIQEKDGEGLLNAAAAWEIFGLCPERALDRFEAAAKFSNPIAAYNAAFMRLEKGNPQDSTIAKQFLQDAADLGDEPAKELLIELSHGTKAAAPRSPK